MTEAQTQIFPGWYDVPGVQPVETRWWNGAAWSPLQLVNGAPRTDNMVSSQGSKSMRAFAIFFVVLAVFMCAAAVWLMVLGAGGSLLINAGPMLLLALLYWTIAARTRRVEQLPKPESAPRLIDSLRPMPGDAEGPGAGWYPMAAPNFQRWWTGARWSEYGLEKGVPVPTFDVARTLANARRTLGWRAIIGLVAFVVGIALCFVPDTGVVGIGVMLIIIGLLVAILLGALLLTLRRRTRQLAIPAEGPRAA